MEIDSTLPILPNPVIPERDLSVDSGEAASAASSDFDAFLTLLTAQLENQDPLSPIDSTEYMAQLASFSMVEQQIGTNERLDVFLDQSLNGDLATFASWIGLDVTLSDGSFRANAEPRTFFVPDVSGADTVVATVSDATGSTVQRFEVTPGVDRRAQWDGLNESGNLVSDADLSINLAYYRSGELIEETSALVVRQITGIRGSESGLTVDFADGGTTAPEEVTRLGRNPE